MIFQQFVKGILIIFIINQIKSEELLNDKQNLQNETNLSNLENLPTIANQADKNSAGEDLDFISLSLDSFASTPANIPETSSLSSTTISNDLKDKETTSSWELIYPEQNSTAITSSTQSFSATSESPVLKESFKISLPKYFKVDDVINCQKFFAQCLKQVLANVVPKLKDSNKSPSLDPLYFNATAFQYNSGPFTGYITIRYALVYGMSTIKFKKLDFYHQNEKFKARLNMLVPKMSVIGAYKGDLQVNNVRVRPKGEFNVSLTALGVEMLSLGALYKKDDHTFLKFTKANATTTLKDSKINATGIFPDQRLNDIVVNVANQYWRDLFNVVLPETRNNWLPILLDALNAALEMVPFDFFDIKS